MVRLLLPSVRKRSGPYSYSPEAHTGLKLQEISSRFPVFPGGISNSSKYPVFPGAVDALVLVTPTQSGLPYARHQPVAQSLQPFAGAQICKRTYIDRLIYRSRITENNGCLASSVNKHSEIASDLWCAEEFWECQLRGNWLLGISCGRLLAHNSNIVSIMSIISLSTNSVLTVSLT